MKITAKLIVLALLSSLKAASVYNYTFDNANAADDDHDKGWYLVDGGNASIGTRNAHTNGQMTGYASGNFSDLGDYGGLMNTNYTSYQTNQVYAPIRDAEEASVLHTSPTYLGAANEQITFTLALGDRANAVGESSPDVILGLGYLTVSGDFSSYVSLAEFTATDDAIFAAGEGVYNDFSVSASILSGSDAIGKELVASLTGIYTGGYVDAATTPGAPTLEQLRFDNARIDVQTIPEPSTGVFLGGAVTALLFRRKRLKN